MSFLYQSGEGLNLLARAAAVKAPTCSPAEDDGYPLSHLFDGRPSHFFRHGTFATDGYVEVDMNLVPNGDGEDATIPAAYVLAGTGVTLAQTASSPYSGSGSLQLQGDGAISAAVTLRLRAGEKARVYHALRSECAHDLVLKVQNLETGLYLDDAGAWQSSPATTVADRSLASWGDGYVDFTMPDVEAAASFWQRLRLTVATADGTAAHDFRFELKVVVGWDLLVWLGHTGRPLVRRPGLEYLALSGNDPGDAWTAGSSTGLDWLKATPSTADPFPDAELFQQSLWNRLQTTRYERWIRLYTTRGSDEADPGAAGEIVLCQAETLPGTSVRPQVTAAFEATGQISMESGAGDPWVYNRTPVPRTRLELHYATPSDLDTADDAYERAARFVLLERPMAGVWPVVVVPYEFDRRMVVYGKAKESMITQYDREQRTRGFDVTVQAYPIPGLHPGLAASAS